MYIQFTSCVQGELPWKAKPSRLKETQKEEKEKSTRHKNKLKATKIHGIHHHHLQLVEDLIENKKISESKKDQYK